MRQNTDRLVALARVLNKSAQGAKADTFIEIPPLLSSVAEMPGSFKAFNNAQVGVDQFDTFRRQDSFTVAGASAGTAINGPVLTPGLWRIEGLFAFQFSGTPSAVNFSNLTLNDVDGATGAHSLALAYHFSTPLNLFQSFRHTIAILFRAQVVATVGATVAGDLANVLTSAFYKKLL